MLTTSSMSWLTILGLGQTKVAVFQLAGEIL